MKTNMHYITVHEFGDTNYNTLRVFMLHPCVTNIKLDPENMNIEGFEIFKPYKVLKQWGGCNP